MLPIPSCPLLFLPQHLTPPPATIAHVCSSPEAMAMAERPGEIIEGGGGGSPDSAPLAHKHLLYSPSLHPSLLAPNPIHHTRPIFPTSLLSRLYLIPPPLPNCPFLLRCLHVRMTSIEKWSKCGFDQYCGSLTFVSSLSPSLSPSLPLSLSFMSHPETARSLDCHPDPTVTVTGRIRHDT